MEEDLQDINPAPLPSPAVSEVRVTAVLDHALLIPDAPGSKQRFNYARWARRETWAHLRPLVAPHITAPPPMDVGNRGRRAEVHLELPLEPARAVLRASSKVGGVCWRPFLEDGSFLITTHITWVAIPPAACTALSRAWALLNGNKDVQGHLAPTSVSGHCHGMLWLQIDSTIYLSGLNYLPCDLRGAVGWVGGSVL